MAPSSVSEIYAVCLLSESYLRENTPKSPEAVRSLVFKFGRTVHDILDIFALAKGEAMVYRIDVQKGVSFQDVEAIYTSFEYLPPATTPEVLYETTRLPGLYEFLTHSIRSAFIWRRLYMHFAHSGSMQERRQFYLNLFETPLSGITRSWIFESLCHDILSAGGDGAFRILPMVKVDGSDAEWTKGTESKFKEELTLTQRTLRTYPVAGAESPDPKGYYIPEGGSLTFNIDMDAFLVQPDDVEILGFKMSIASGTSMKTRGTQTLVKKLVFVIPSGHAFHCHCDATTFGSEFRLYTLEVDVQAASTESRTKFPEGAFDLAPGEIAVEDDLVL